MYMLFFTGVVAGYLRACDRLISWVRVIPSAYSYRFVGISSCAHIDSRKARKRVLAIIEESRRAMGMLTPMRDKLKARTGGKRWHLRPQLDHKLGSKSETKTPQKFVGISSCAHIDSRKARKRELAIIEESRRAMGMLTPMRDKT